MVLKEAYHYQNYLDGLIEQAESYLSNSNFVTSVSETHLRHKANPDAEDEVIERKSSVNIGCTPNQMIQFVVDAIEEKQKLTDAISNAKKGSDQDSRIAMNKVRHQFINVLTQLARLKPVETTTRGNGYKFDVNGEQKSYYYDVISEVKINFDRKDVRGLIQKYTKECDKISSELDEVLVLVEVDYKPRWDSADLLEDILESEYQTK